MDTMDMNKLTMPSNNTTNQTGASIENSNTAAISASIDRVDPSLLHKVKLKSVNLTSCSRLV